jgi:hypothetical protein
MPRPKRLPSIPFGWYYVALRSVAHRRLVTSGEDLASLLALLRATLRRQGARLHAGYVSEREVRLVLQVGERPLNSITRRLQHDYALAFNRTHHERGSLFRLHHQAFLFEHPRWLVPLIHHLHWMPRREAASEERSGLWWGSDAVYRGLERRDWVTTCVVLRMLARGSHDRRRQEEGYRALLEQPPQPNDSFPFKQARKMDPRILGGADFIAAVWNLSGRRTSTSGRKRDVLELEAAMSAAVGQLIDRLLALCDARLPGPRAATWRRLVTCDSLRSGSRKRPLPMVRALSASHLIERKIATAGQAAQFFSCGAAPVSARRRFFYGKVFQEIFDVDPGILARVGKQPIIGGSTPGLSGRVVMQRPAKPCTPVRFRP